MPFSIPAAVGFIALGSILMGVFANLPVALAPAMGLNAFAFVVVQAMGLPAGRRRYFLGRCGLLLLDDFPRTLLDDCQYPKESCVSCGIPVVGLFIGMMGAEKPPALSANKDTLVSIGNLTSHSVSVGRAGLYHRYSGIA